MIVHFTGYGYPYASDSRNIGDDVNDEVLTYSNNPPTRTVYAAYKPPAVQGPGWAPSRQNVPNKPSDLEVERLVNGVQRVWGLENPDEPLVFPLPSDPAKPQHGPVQPQSTLLSVASTNGMPAYPSAGDSTYSSPTAYYAPSTTSQAAKSPSSESWQPEPDSSGYGVVDLNSGAAGGNINHLVYEDVFDYPSESAEPSHSYGSTSNTAGWYGQATDESQESSTRYASTLEKPSAPWYPTNAGAQPVYPSRTESSSGGVNFNFGQAGYQPRDDKVSWRPQKTYNTQKVAVSQRVSEPILPPAPPPSYIIQSRNGYQRGRYILKNTRYSPEFDAPMPVSSKGVKGPAPSRPAAPNGVKSPQRYI